MERRDGARRQTRSCLKTTHGCCQLQRLVRPQPYQSGDSHSRPRPPAGSPLRHAGALTQPASGRHSPELPLPRGSADCSAALRRRASALSRRADGPTCAGQDALRTRLSAGGRSCARKRHLPIVQREARMSGVSERLSRAVTLEGTNTAARTPPMPPLRRPSRCKTTLSIGERSNGP